jgi:SET domain-containing protein
VDVPEPEADCWLHPAVVVAESPIEGRGLFCTAPIAAGTLVARLGGRLVDGPELRDLLHASAAYVDTVTVLSDRHLVLPGRQPIGFGNHSCDPTLWHTSAFALGARRDLAAGEEVTVDYATQTAEPDFTLDCRCGSALCRGTVTGDDWRRPDLQERYGEHWVPALRLLIDA